MKHNLVKDIAFQQSLTFRHFSSATSKFARSTWSAKGSRLRASRSLSSYENYSLSIWSQFFFFFYKIISFFHTFVSPFWSFIILLCVMDAHILRTHPPHPYAIIFRDHPLSVSCPHQPWQHFLPPLESPYCNSPGACLSISSSRRSCHQSARVLVLSVPTVCCKYRYIHL